MDFQPLADLWVALLVIGLVAGGALVLLIIGLVKLITEHVRLV